MRTIAWLATGLVALAACSSDDGGSSGSTAGGAGSTSTTTGSGGATTSSSATGGGSTGTGGAGGGTGDTWTNYAKGFFATYCIECHGAGDALRDYTTLAGVAKESAEIRCGVGPVLESGCMGFPPPK